MIQAEKVIPTSHYSVQGLFWTSLVALCLVLSACSSSAGEQGEACFVDEDCAEPWNCDLHGKEVGTCQEPHSH